MRATVRRGVVLAIASVAIAAGAAAQSGLPQAEPCQYELGVSSQPMLRNAVVFVAAGALVDRGLNTAVDLVIGSPSGRRGWTGVVERVARLYFIDMPVASLTQSGNHEYGHVLRVVYDTPHVMHLTDWPWPVPLTGAEVLVPFLGRVTDYSELSAIAGGMEADFVAAETVLDRVYTGNTASQFDLVLYVYAKAHRSLYALTGRGGDPYSYAAELAFVRSRPFPPPDGEQERMYRSIQKGAWANLLDFALGAAVERVMVGYVARGRSVLEPAWLRVGPLALAPSFNYTFTPRGQQYRVNSRVRLAWGVADANVRWTQPMHADYAPNASLASNPLHSVPTLVRLVGGGIAIRSTARRPIAPAISIDAWRDTNGRMAGRVELGGVVRPSRFRGRGALQLTVGGKSAGYLPGFREGAGPYLTAALLVTF